MGKTIRHCFWFVLGFVIVFLVFLWFISGLKWLIKAWGRIPIPFLTFLELSQFSPRMDLGSFTYYQNMFKHTGNSEIISTQIAFLISQHLGNLRNVLLESKGPQVPDTCFRWVQTDMCSLSF